MSLTDSTDIWGHTSRSRESVQFAEFVHGEPVHRRTRVRDVVDGYGSGVCAG